MRSDHRGLGVPNLDFNLKAWEATRDSERGNSGSDLPERGLGSRVERGGLLSGQQQGGNGTGRESSPALRRSRGRGEGGWKTHTVELFFYFCLCPYGTGAPNCEALDTIDLFSESGV